MPPNQTPAAHRRRLLRSLLITAALTLVLAACSSEQRPFQRFSDLTAEVLEARIWAGIHFRHSDVQAVKIGHEVESYVDTHWFSAAQ